MSTKTPPPSSAPPESVPPHQNAEPHQQLVDALSKMSKVEIFELSVRAGVHNPDGTLTENYRTRPKR